MAVPPVFKTVSILGLMMIKLEDVTVDIPVFLSEYSRSMRTSIANRMLGGRLSSATDGKVVIRALDNVSLAIPSGQRVGLVGSNGAGKTTLLRVIAGVVPVSSGTVNVDGDVRSFFNISAGLDPMRSGMRNIETVSLFHTRDFNQIRDATQRIVEFADLGEFIHLPVCSYSAGMQTRLLVAIATAYQGEILLFDELIGAGDASFLAKLEAHLEKMVGQAKCLLIASHSEDILRRICTSAIWMERGHVRAMGDVDEVLSEYANHPATAVG